MQTHLFLPYFLQHSLEHEDMPAALSLCSHYSHLSYFPHALEVLLHHVLDEEVENESRDNKLNVPAQDRKPLLPSVIAFLQASLPGEVYLDTVVQCTRKTELRSWRTLFSYLPPAKELFEQALRYNSLKTAVGYLLVLQAFDDGEGHDARMEDYVVRLFILASRKGDWELCAELARFLIALDASGDMLRRSVSRMGLKNGANLAVTTNSHGSSPNLRGLGLMVPTYSRPGSLSSLSPRSGRLDRDDASASSGGNDDISINSGGISDSAPMSPGN